MRYQKRNPGGFDPSPINSKRRCSGAGDERVKKTNDHGRGLSGGNNEDELRSMNQRDA
jgi:hypothetical protein